MLDGRAPLAIRTESDAASTTIELHGEIDVNTVQRFVDAIDAALADRPAVLCLDLRGVTLAASCAVAALVRTRRITASRGTALTLVPGDAGGAVPRLLALTGLERVFDLYPTPESARSLMGGSLRESVLRRRALEG